MAHLGRLFGSWVGAQVGSMGRVEGQPVRIRRTLAVVALVISAALVTAATPASAGAISAGANAIRAGAGVEPTATTATDKPAPPVVDAQILTPAQLARQVKAAASVRAQLTRSGADVAAANGRLERLSARANTLLANLSVARTAQVEAETEATIQTARLVTLGVQVRSSQDALGQLASDSYVRSGGPLGDIVAIIGALTTPAPGQNTDSLATMHYLVDARGRIFRRLQSLQAEQVRTSARAQAASSRAEAATKSAEASKLELDSVIVGQRAALTGFQAARVAQVRRAAGIRSVLLRSEKAAEMAAEMAAEKARALAADRLLAQTLAGQDLTRLLAQGSTCGNDTATYPNGRRPASALCPLYKTKGESLSRAAAMAFNAMSTAYERTGGSALCVTDGYRSYPEQVAVKRKRPRLAATPGTSRHGLGLAVDLCGGVQNFASPAHLWMQRHAPLYGWFHPPWAEPRGVLPEPWHWEFAQ